MTLAPTVLCHGSSAVELGGALAGRLAAPVVLAPPGQSLTAALADDWSIAVVVVELDVLDDAALAALVRAAAIRVVAVVDGDRAEAAGAYSGSNLAEFVAADSPPDLVAAAVMRAAERPTITTVAELSERTSARLDRLNRDASQIASALAGLQYQATAATTAQIGRIDSAYVRALIRARRMREQFLAAELFSDPAWDMLLDLTAAELEGRKVSVSSLCIAAAAPTTTALRWIRNLCDAGLFDRQPDPHDARRAFISLDAQALQRMLAYLAALRASLPIAP